MGYIVCVSIFISLESLETPEDFTLRCYVNSTFFHHVARFMFFYVTTFCKGLKKPSQLRKTSSSLFYTSCLMSFIKERCSFGDTMQKYA